MSEYDSPRTASTSSRVRFVAVTRALFAVVARSEPVSIVSTPSSPITSTTRGDDALDDREAVLGRGTIGWPWLAGVASCPI